MDVRKSAVTMSVSERENFLKALISLKNTPAGPGLDYSIYDQFVALHEVVMRLIDTPTEPEVNLGHWNIGFLPWHREYLRRFEEALQSMVPGVTLPYWDWTADVEAASDLFTPTFLGRRYTSSANPRRITSGYLAHTAPTGSARPAWWPSQAVGWRIHPNLQELRYPAGTPDRETLNATLHRGSSLVRWPPTSIRIRNLIRLHSSPGGANHYWEFWNDLEGGARTHNAGHNHIGGHMGGRASPNDPIFWLHHANVDRVWALWQDFHQKPPHSPSLEDDYPSPTEASPINGRLAPSGHKLNDLMWPWIGTASGYQVRASATLRDMLIDYSAEPRRRVRQVLDHRRMGYRYDGQSQQSP